MDFILCMYVNGEFSHSGLCLLFTCGHMRLYLTHRTTSCTKEVQDAHGWLDCIEDVTEQRTLGRRNTDAT